MKFKSRRMTGALGIEVWGFRLARQWNRQLLEELKTLWCKNEVLVIRDQDLNSEEYLRFGRAFGELAKNYFFFKSLGDGSEEIAKVVKEKGEARNTGGIWHHDQAYYPEPVKGIMLYGVELPHLGGDTLFASMTAAYKRLPKSLKDRIQNHQVLHSTSLMRAKRGRADDQVDKILNAMKLEEAVHPAVCVDSETNQPFLYVNRTTTEKIIGLEKDASDELLNQLYQHIEKPDFNCRLRWDKGTIVIWNNHKVLHYAVNDYNERRVLHRIHFSAESPRSFA